MNKCIECENETMLKYSNLYCEYEDLQERFKVTTEMLHATTKLSDYLAKKCEELENKVRLYQEKLESEADNE